MSILPGEYSPNTYQLVPVYWICYINIVKLVTLHLQILVCGFSEFIFNSHAKSFDFLLKVDIEPHHL